MQIGVFLKENKLIVLLHTLFKNQSTFPWQQVSKYVKKLSHFLSIDISGLEGRGSSKFDGGGTWVNAWGQQGGT